MGMSRPPVDPIRVVFDVTHLGEVHQGPRRSTHRTGLHRVVEQTVQSVAAEPGVAVTLAADANWELALGYVEDHPGMRDLPFPGLGRRRLESRIRDWAVASHVRSGAGRGGALAARVANRLATDANRTLDRLALSLGRGPHGAGDVFHSPLLPLPPATHRARGVRYFLTVFDLIPQLFPDIVAPWEVGWNRRISDSIGPDDHVLAISEHTKRDLLEAYPALAPERVTVTPLAADPAIFYPAADPARLAAVRAKYALPDGPYLLSLSTLAPHKNIPRLLRAFAELVRAERVDDLRLVLAGARGGGYDEILRELDQLGAVSDRIRFAGYVDDEDLAPLYSGALAFVYPSYYEGFGLPPLEAMQCGTPVITGDRASLPEVVGDAGLMVDPYDVDALAQALLRVYRDEALRAELSRRAVARAGTFTWARFAERTVAAYRAAL
ncbi:hypothetical protein tb265_43440 [Gemmatimonadetes bacterium T265]|nr:hypothetical protein tb265_43440 [Gemmatimonadetes bacterium T265]